MRWCLLVHPLPAPSRVGVPGNSPRSNAMLPDHLMHASPSMNITRACNKHPGPRSAQDPTGHTAYPPIASRMTVCILSQVLSCARDGEPMVLLCAGYQQLSPCRLLQHSSSSSPFWAALVSALPASPLASQIKYLRHHWATLRVLLRLCTCTEAVDAQGRGPGSGAICVKPNSKTHTLPQGFYVALSGMRVCCADLTCAASASTCIDLHEMGVRSDVSTGWASLNWHIACCCLPLTCSFSWAFSTAAISVLQ